MINKKNICSLTIAQILRHTLNEQIEPTLNELETFRIPHRKQR